MSSRSSTSEPPGSPGAAQPLKERPLLSIVIPARDEQKKIGADIGAASAFLAGLGSPGEILVVDDGSRDATAQEASRAPVAASVSRAVLALERRGKGAALRAGAAASRGAFVLFSDSGGCIPFEHSLRGIDLIRSGACAIAIASRRHPATQIVAAPSPFRRIGSRLFMALIHRLAGIHGLFSDTQCGFKVFRGDVVRELCAEAIATGFMLDIELILRARRHGFRIQEFPVRWTCDRDTRLRPLPAALSSLLELRRILAAVGRAAVGPGGGS